MQKKTYLKQAVSLFLTLGAGLTLGLLSFAGMYALAPIIPLASASFILSTLYEGEIYNSNIQSAIDKLFTKFYYKQKKANELLERLMTDELQELTESTPFLSDYKEQRLYISQLHALEHRDRTQQLALANAKKRLRDMQRFFMKTLFSGEQNNSDYARSLHAAVLNLNLDEGKLTHPSILAETKRKQRLINWGFGLSLVAGLFVGIGTSYLLIESIATLTFLSVSAAAMPFVVIPLSVLAAAGYVYLTFNSLSDMIWNDTLQKWYAELKTDIKTCSKGRAAGLIITSVLLVTMAVALSLATAGTWWTVVRANPRFLGFLTRIPASLAAAIAGTVAALSGIGQLIFGLENIKESYDSITGKEDHKHSDETEQKDATTTPTPNISRRQKVKNFFLALGLIFWLPLKNKLISPIHNAWKNESKWQFFNPFRFLVNLIEKPVRVLGFLAHIGSIAMTADRVPGVPALFCAILAAVEEGAEDFHYFFGGHHEEQGSQGHDHSNDIPTRLIKFILLPLYYLSAAWHSKTSRFTDAPVSWQAAKEKQFGTHHEHTEPEPIIEPVISSSWQKQCALMQLDEKISAYNKGNDSKKGKAAALTNLRTKVESMHASTLNQTSFMQIVNDQEEGDSISLLLGKHRHWMHADKPTAGTQFLASLSDEILPASTYST